MLGEDDDQEKKKGEMTITGTILLSVRGKGREGMGGGAGRKVEQRVKIP